MCILPKSEDTFSLGPYNIQSTLVISNSRGLSDHFEISAPRHIRVAEVRKTIN